MPVCGCSNGVFATFLLALLLVPVQYYAPDLYEREPEAAVITLPTSTYTFRLPRIADYPTFDTILYTVFLLSMLVIYVCDWMHRKLLEKRILKLNQHVKKSLDELVELDLRQEQTEKTLHAVNKATAEYSLLLYLLLQRSRQGPHEPPLADGSLDKHLNEFSFGTGNAVNL